MSQIKTTIQGQSGIPCTYAGYWPAYCFSMTCFLHGQVYLAETSLAQDLRETDQVKIVRARSQSVAAKTPFAAAR